MRGKWILSFSACVALSASAARAADFVPDDRIVSDPTMDLPQPELDQVGHRLVWQDRFRQLWLADVDPVTGAITPLDGRGVRVDTDLAPVGEVGNTPRFTYGAGQSVLVYDKKPDGVLHLAAAREHSPGVWITELLVDGEDRYRMEGTPEDSPDPPRIAYNRATPQGATVVSWRELDDPATERTAVVTGAQGGRFLGTERALLVSNKISGVVQVMQFDFDTAVGEVITSGTLNKLNPYIWYAPELEDLAFVVMLSFTELAVYTRVAGVWTELYRFALPTAKPFVSSAEGFVSNGKSYISVVAAAELGPDPFPGQPVGPTEIWLAGIDPDAPFFRRIDDPSYAAQRSEPEPYLLAGGPVVYYTELVEATGQHLLKLAQTGLAADYGYDSAAYGGAWSVMHRDARNSASVPFAIAAQYTNAGAVTLPNRQFQRATLGPEGNLYVPISAPSGGGTAQSLVAVDTDAGQERYRIPESVTTSRLSAVNVLIDARGQYYVPANEALSKFDANGNLRWQIPTRGFARSAQFAPDGNLVMFTWNAWVYVVDPAGGTVLSESNTVPWRTFPPQPSCLSGGTPASCAYINAPAVDAAANRIYNTLTRTDGDTTIQAFAYDRTSHQLSNVWQAASPIVTGVAGSPVLSPDYARLYVQDGVGNLVAVDAASGAVAWSFALGFVSPEAPPVMSPGGYIMPGGTAGDAPGYDFVGVLQDLGSSAQWVLQDIEHRPACAAAAGAGDRFVLAVRKTGGTALSLLVVHPQQGIVGETAWSGPQPRTLKGLTVREDGRIFVQTEGQFGAKVFAPLP